MIGEGTIRQQFVEFPPLSWKASSYQLYQTVSQSIDAFVQAGSIPLCLIVFKWRETSIALVGAASRFLCSFLEAITFGSPMFIAAAVGGLFKYVGVVLFRTLSSAQVGDDEQGRLFSILSLGELLSTYPGVFLYSAMLSVSAGWHWKGMPFAFSSLVALYPIAIVVLLHLRR